VGRNLCMSAVDLGKVAAEYLKDAAGQSTYLKPATFKTLFNPLPPTGSGRAWALAHVGWARGQILWHSGSTLKNFALCHIVPAENFAICIVTNIWYKDTAVHIDTIYVDIARLIQAGKFSGISASQ